MKQCAKCRGHKLERGRETLRRTVDGIVFEGRVDATVCLQCGEAYIDARVLHEFELCIAAELSRTGHCTTEALGFMRAALGA